MLKPADHLRIETAEEKKHSSSVVASKLSNLRTVLTGIWYGIPIELAFTIDPTTKKALLEEFYQRTTGVSIIGQNVSVMLELLERHFPKLEKHSTQWIDVRAHFFGCVGLWGRCS